VVDVGAGDGRFALEAARADPRTLAVALDASTDRLVEGARTALRHRLPNAIFVVSALEQLPDALAGVADRATIHFPWGSLLRGVTCGDDAILAPLARLVRAAGELDLVLQTGDIGLSAFERQGFVLLDRHVATAAEVALTRSSWAKRLGIGPARPAFAFRFRRIRDR
jgi:16S rRNA (adenine(1408)-N(1))-methyltransferase